MLNSIKELAINAKKNTKNKLKKTKENIKIKLKKTKENTKNKLKITKENIKNKLEKTKVNSYLQNPRMNIINSYENNFINVKVMVVTTTFHDILIVLKNTFFTATNLWSFCMVRARQLVVLEFSRFKLTDSLEAFSWLYSVSFFSSKVSIKFSVFS